MPGHPKGRNLPIFPREGHLDSIAEKALVHSNAIIMSTHPTSVGTTQHRHTPHFVLIPEPRGKSPFLRTTRLRAWGWPQSWHPRHCSHTFTWAKGFKPIAWKAPSSHTPPQSKKEQWEMLLRVGAEGARGWRPGSRTQPSVPAGHHQPVGVRRPPLALAPRPAPELPAAA